MCESNETRREPSPERTAGNNRLRQLREWIAEDEAAPGRAPQCVVRWRDEVAGRIPRWRPIKVRVPECIASFLLERGMCSPGFTGHRCVTIHPDGSVVERIHAKGQPDEKGKELVAATEK